MRWISAAYASLRALMVAAFASAAAGQAQQPSPADDTAWGKAQQSGTSAAFQGYLEDFPGGRHVDEALNGLLGERIETELGATRGGIAGTDPY